MEPVFTPDIAASSIAQFELQMPGGFVPVIEPPKGSFAPVVVASGFESAQALAKAGVLPGPALILAAVSVEALAALDLPAPSHGGWLATPHQGRLVLVFDGTPESRAAASQAARRAKAASWTVDVLPASLGALWTDLLAGRAPRPEAHLARIADLWIPLPADDPRAHAEPDESAPALARQPEQPTKDLHEEAQL